MRLVLLIACSLTFAITHLGMSHGSVRVRLVARLGELPFRGLYSAVSFMTLGPAVYIGLDSRHLGPMLFALPWWLERVISVPLMLLAVQLVVLGFANPSPTGMVPARPEVRGVLRVTRHPFNMGVGCFALAHLLANGALGDVVLFSSILVVAIGGAFHQDARKARDRGAVYQEFREQTSVLPFVAAIGGRTRVSLSELPYPMVVVGIVVWATLLVLHGQLFGVSLLG